LQKEREEAVVEADAQALEKSKLLDFDPHARVRDMRVKGPPGTLVPDLKVITEVDLNFYRSLTVCCFKTYIFLFKII